MTVAYGSAEHVASHPAVGIYMQSEVFVYSTPAIETLVERKKGDITQHPKI